jgi:hypothetical protein
MDVLRPAYTGTMAEGVGGRRRLAPVSERAAASAPAAPGEDA